MAVKQFQIDGLGVIKIYKRRNSRSLRLSVTPEGEVRVSIPMWAPYSAGLTFVRSKQAWILQQRPSQPLLLPGQLIGKAHRLVFEARPESVTPAARLKQTEILVTYPPQLSVSEVSVQKVARAAGLRALRRQAEQLLPQRTAQLAAEHEFSYASVSVKQLKGRWGSCDQHQKLVFNLFLMQLPWECIDYVILHELTHTKVLRHGPPFWAALESVLPRTQQLRRQMRRYQPILAVQTPLPVA